ncbi:7-deoxyloganetin glucosyltransferase [Ranunculus cassubicifolius]
MGSNDAVKPHAVCIPAPAQGHISPMMQLTKLLHARGFHITFVNTEFNHKRLLNSKGPDALKGLDDFRFEAIPDGLPPCEKDATQDVPQLCYSTRATCLNPLVELIKKLNATCGIPKVSLIVSDGVMSFAIQAGKILGIPEVQSWTTSACGFMDESYLTNGYLDTPVDWIPGMKNMRLKDLPSFIRSTDPDDIMLNFMGEEAQNCLNASAVLINTFDDLEQDVLDAIAVKCPKIYTLGPLQLLGNNQLQENELTSIRSSLWKEDTSCLDWLDKREPDSVMYVSFGSITGMTEEELREFAWGLANSGQAFLWIIRSDAVMGDEAIIPEEFLHETKDRGMIASWCAQDKVLCHPAVGGFLTHCGWNSTIESISAGVPVICWPFFAEQQTNARYACANWEIGMEIESDVKRDDIEELVREMIAGVKGKKLRNKSLEWKEKADVATKEGGSSYKNFDRFIKEVLH